jgi:succinate dehydrogenase/fumarate reductase flavoprotein subunit
MLPECRHMDFRTGKNLLFKTKAVVVATGGFRAFLPVQQIRIQQPATG